MAEAEVFQRTSRNVKNYGAKGDGVTDDTAAIQATIDSQLVAGGVVYFPPGDYKISSTLTIGNGSATQASTRPGVVLQGASHPGYSWLNGDPANPNRTRLFAASGFSNAADLIAVNGPISGWGLQWLELDGMLRAGQGLHETSCKGGNVEGVVIRDCVNIGQWLSTWGNYSGVGNPNHSHNRYKDVLIGIPNLNNAYGMNIGANTVDANSDSWGDIWEHLQVAFAQMPTAGVTVTGVILKNCDSERFNGLFFERASSSGSGGTLYTVVFSYGQATGAVGPCNTRMETVDFYPTYLGTSGTVINSGSLPGAAAQFANRILDIETCNGYYLNPQLANVEWEYSNVGRNGALSVQRSASDSLTNSVNTIQQFAKTYSIPASMLYAGKVLRVSALMLSTSPASPVTETFTLKIGSTIVYTSAAETPNASRTNQGWMLEWVICGTAAPGGAVAVDTFPVVNRPVLVETNQTAQPVNIATNAAQALSLSVTFSATGSNQTEVLQDLIVVGMN